MGEDVTVEPLNVVALVVALLTALLVLSISATNGKVGDWILERLRRFLGR